MCVWKRLNLIYFDHESYGEREKKIDTKTCFASPTKKSFCKAVLAALIMQWFNSTSTKSSELFPRHSKDFQTAFESILVDDVQEGKASLLLMDLQSERLTFWLISQPSDQVEKKMFQSEWVGGDCRWTGTSCECFLGDFTKFPIWTVQGVGLVSDIMIFFFFTCICRVGLKSSWEVSSRAKSIILLYKRMRGTYVGYQKLKSSMT